MSLVRAIVRRFARYLVRIARRLDPTLVAAPYRATPEQMAALRLRHPGAPQHWIELVAQRAIVDDLPKAEPPNSAPPDALPPEAVTADAVDEPAFPNGRRELHENPHGDLVRQARQRTAAQFNAVQRSVGRARRVAAKQSGAIARIRPAITFVSKRMRRPIADLLIIDASARSRPMLKFKSNRPSSRQSAPVESPENIHAKPERPLVFHDLVLPDDRDHRARFESSRDEVRAPTDSRWPELRPRNDAAEHSPKVPAGSSRPMPTFPFPDERWPNLPGVDDHGVSSLAPTTEEAKLACEQVGGTWSA